MFDRQRKYAIRKIAIGTISAVIGSFMVGSTDVSAKEVNVEYKYVTLNELTEDEKKLIKTNQHELVAKEDKTYYMVYRPVNTLPSTSAIQVTDNAIGLGILTGSALLLAAICVGKNRRKKLNTFIVLTTVGSSIIAPNAFAIENKELLRFNQELSLTVEADLPDPLKIDGYEFIGYIDFEKEEKIVNKVAEVQENEVKAPVHTQLTPVVPTQQAFEYVPAAVQEAPVARIVTETPVTRVITEAPVTRVVTEAPVTRIVTEAPITRVVTEAPVTQIVSDASTTQIVTEAPVTQIITEAPVTKIITEKPKEIIVVEEKPTLEFKEKVVETQPIPFATTYIEDANMWADEKEVVTPGSNGEKSVVEITPSIGGKVLENNIERKEQVKTPITQVEKIGTKPVQGQTTEIVKETVTTKVEYVEDKDSEANKQTLVKEGQEGLKEIHNLYETIKGEKTNLISSDTRVVITEENKVVAVGVKDSEREEITAYTTIYQEDPTQTANTRTETQKGVEGITKYRTPYTLDKLNGVAVPGVETSEETQRKQDMIVVVGTMPTTRTETRKYSIEYKSSDTLEVGQEQIEIPGKDGSVLYTTTYNLNKDTGLVTANPEVEKVTEAVVNQVILVGTKPKVVTRTINYKMEDGSTAPEKQVQKVEFTKEILSTNSVTGLRTYSDWKTTNNEFASVDSPVIAKYTADKKVVDKETVTADTTDKTVDVLYKVNIIETEDKRVIKRTINYLYEEDKSKVFDPFVQELTYTRTKFTNEVTGEVKYGDWKVAAQDFAEKISPEKDGYTADIEKVNILATTPDSKDEEVTVLYTDKFIEVKDVDTASLYYSLEDDSYTRVMALDKLPTDFNNYYVKVKSDQFKDLQLSVKSITEDTVNDQPVYKVVTTHPKLKQDENYNGYEEDYTIYVAKADNLPGVKTFRELLEKIKANPAENIVLANDISAEGYDLSVKDAAYITEKFTGILSGKNGDKNFAIYDLKAPLFATIGKATVSDLALKNVDIDANHYDKVGALAGRTEGTTIKNVVVQGNLAASNNYGSPDTNEHGPAKVVLGGLVAEAAAGTVLENNTFVGNINGDSTGVRYWTVSNQGSVTELVLGGLAGSVSGNSRLTANRVAANIHINAVDGLAINWAKSSLGNPLSAGGLIGATDSGMHTNNYVEGTLTNQVDNKNTRYEDGVDRSNITGNVGGLFGNAYAGFRAQNNTTAMKVINGAIVSPTNNNPQKTVTDLASGDKPNSGQTTPVAQAEVAPLKDEITKALELTKQYITNTFDVDYTKVKGYQESYAKAYANMEKLLPFYNRAFIVKEANKLAATDKLVTGKLLSVTPMKDSVVISDVSGDKQAINKLLLHFADSSVEYKDVTYKEDFKNTKIAEYKITGTDITYTTDQFVNSYETVVDAVKADLAAVSYTGEEVWQALNTVASAVNVTKIRELYLEERFTEIQANIDKVLKNVLGTSTAYSNTNDVIEYIKKNKAELLLGLSYVSRWYNIDFNAMNVQNIITYQPDFFGKQVSTLEWLVEVGSAGYRALDPKVSDEKAASLVGENNDTESLQEILESYRKVFAADKSFEDWFKSSIKAYVATGKAIDNVSENEIGNSDVYHQLNTRMTGIYWGRGAGNVDYSNMVLPLLTARKDRLYIISTGSSVQFGSLDAYVDRELKTSNPDEYNKKLEEIKAKIDKVAKNQAKHWEAWYAVANTDVQDKLVSNKPVWDSLFIKTAKGRIWSDRFGANASEAIKDFFGPLGRHGDKAPGANQEAYSDGTNVGYTGGYALTPEGESIWSHEQVHNWDGGVYLGGHGRRPGAGMEAFAEGLLQAPRSDYDRIRYSLGVNMYFDNTPENNPFPEYNSSPERFQTADDLKAFVKGMMDVLYVMDYAEAKSILTLPQDQQIARLTKLTPVAKGDHKDDLFVSVTAEDLKNVTDINGFVDAGLALSRYYNNNKVGDLAGFDFYKSYVKVNMFSPFYGLAQNDTGASGAYTFRRTAFELLAEYGYQAFIDYASGKHKTDKAAVEAILNGAYNNNLTDFKKAMFKQRIDNLPNLKPITFTSGNQKYTISNEADLQAAMDTLVKAGNHNNIVNFKRDMYLAYIKDTNEFKTSIFSK